MPWCLTSYAFREELLKCHSARCDAPKNYSKTGSKKRNTIGILSLFTWYIFVPWWRTKSLLSSSASVEMRGMFSTNTVGRIFRNSIWMRQFSFNLFVKNISYRRISVFGLYRDSVKYIEPGGIWLSPSKWIYCEQFGCNVDLDHLGSLFGSCLKIFIIL